MIITAALTSKVNTIAPTITCRFKIIRKIRRAIASAMTTRVSRHIGRRTIRIDKSAAEPMIP